MPKITDREKLAELRERKRRVSEEIEQTQARVRDRYARIVPELPVEELTEREFREVLALAVQHGGEPAVAALKALAGPAAAPAPKRMTTPAPGRAGAAAAPDQHQP